ncbi:MAG: aminotransferase class III-fold pyridoxal phosphate-dependent enzyme, partial [Pseudonocardiaceae bacterium]
ARIAPGDPEVVHLCSTGSQARDVALTLAQRARVPGRSEVAHVSRIPGERRVPFGDTGALADALRSRRIGTVILDTAGIDPPRPGYLNQLRRLCDEHEALWIADETNCGIGRTGRYFAFEHAGVVPDLVVVAKSLAGGEAVVGAAIVRGPVHRRAAPDAVSTSPPGDTARACCAAVETLAVLDDEDLVGNAERTGRYLLRRLAGLRQCYPHLVSAVRGRGLLAGVHLPGITDVIGTLLLAEHRVLVAFSDHNQDHSQDHDVLRLEPPLTIRPEYVDHFVDALDELLSRGPRRLADDYRRAVRTWRPDQLDPYREND